MGGEGDGVGDKPLPLWCPLGLLNNPVAVSGMDTSICVKYGLS